MDGFMKKKTERQTRLKVLRTGDPRSQFVTSTAKEILRRLGRPRFLLSSSSKVRKGESLGVLTKVLYLSPGVLCPAASKGCLATCLGHSSGFMKEQRATDARDRRTALFIEDRRAFIELLRNEIHEHFYAAETQGMKPALRLNGTSDVDWVKEHPELFVEFSEVQFYDYTKRIDLMRRYLFPTGYPAPEKEHFPVNYHLTFSLSERNAHHAKEVLDWGGNVAAVFWPSLPESWKGYEVVDGDKYDARFLDQGPPEKRPGVVIGLSAKGFVAQKDDLSGFVIRTDKTARSFKRRSITNGFAA